MAEMFDITWEQYEMQKVVRKFANELCTERLLLSLMEEESPYSRELFTRLAEELGILGLAVPPEHGGTGGGVIELAMVVEELGAALFPGPVFGTIYLALRALAAAAPSSEPAAELLPALLGGSKFAAVAMPAPSGRYDAEAITVRAEPVAGGWALEGEIGQVVDAAGADLLLVAARQSTGIGLFAVDSGAPGLSVRKLQTLDLTRTQADVRFAGTPAQEICNPDVAGPVLHDAMVTAGVLLAAEQLGTAQFMLDQTASYAKSRIQFGRPIGSFQAIKHELADLMISVEQARSVAYHAAWLDLHGTSEETDLAASVAQAVCADAAYEVAAASIQLHGGIGFTWEHPAHRYFKRAVSNSALLGSAEQHRDRVAAAVLDVASPPESPLPVADGN